MNVYECSGCVPSGCGCCSDSCYEVIGTANTEGEMLGFLLDRFTETQAEHWTLYKVDLSIAGIQNY